MLAFFRLPPLAPALIRLRLAACFLALNSCGLADKDAVFANGMHSSLEPFQQAQESFRKFLKLCKVSSLNKLTVCPVVEVLLVSQWMIRSDDRLGEGAGQPCSTFSAWESCQKPAAAAFCTCSDI